MEARWGCRRVRRDRGVLGEGVVCRRVQWEREGAVGEGGCSGKGRVQWEREGAVGEGGCSERRVQCEREGAV